MRIHIKQTIVSKSSHSASPFILPSNKAAEKSRIERKNGTNDSVMNGNFPFNVIPLDSLNRIAMLHTSELKY